MLMDVAILVNKASILLRPRSAYLLPFSLVPSPRFPAAPPRARGAADARRDSRRRHRSTRGQDGPARAEMQRTWCRLQSDCGSRLHARREIVQRAAELAVAARSDPTVIRTPGRVSARRMPRMSGSDRVRRHGLAQEKARPSRMSPSWCRRGLDSAADFGWPEMAADVSECRAFIGCSIAGTA